MPWTLLLYRCFYCKSEHWTYSFLQTISNISIKQQIWTLCSVVAVLNTFCNKKKRSAPSSIIKHSLWDSGHQLTVLAVFTILLLLRLLLAAVVIVVVGFLFEASLYHHTHAHTNKFLYLFNGQKPLVFRWWNFMLCVCVCVCVSVYRKLSIQWLWQIFQNYTTRRKFKEEIIKIITEAFNGYVYTWCFITKIYVYIRINIMFICL